MNTSELALLHLRAIDIRSKVGDSDRILEHAGLLEWMDSGVKFSARGRQIESIYYSAVRQLLSCIHPIPGQGNILHEGGVYAGCWLESTGSISAETLSRFMPSVAEETLSVFGKLQRADGMIPYKVTDTGPGFTQIQMVTPFARSVWKHYQLRGKSREFMQPLYHAMARHDGWLDAHRNTRKTGCVEAFCTYDTGHDLSSRFWHIPDTTYLGDPAQFDPASPLLPLLAPDLTANVYCQRIYLAKIADELGFDSGDWEELAQKSLRALFEYCYDPEDCFFYDRDNCNQFVRVKSDVLLRVLACEIGDRAFFDQALRKYLLNTSHFFSKYPLTSLSMSDPRFDPSSSYNSWGGTSNFLSLLRAPHAFEYHGRFVELTWIMQPIVNALSRMSRFAQNLNPWTGEEGYTEAYSPTMLCLLDYIERLCGILPTPDGELWFSGLLPATMDRGEVIAEETGYARIVDGIEYELVNTRRESLIYRNGQRYATFPHGTRLVLRRNGALKALVGLNARLVEGHVSISGTDIKVSIEGNQRLVWSRGGFHSADAPGIVVPNYQ